MTISAVPFAALVDDARAARAHAYAPYSRFYVGAALLCSDGTVFRGANVENASYGLCICAERTAVAAAVAHNHRAFRAIAIATHSDDPSPPCGMCRQVLAEFLSATHADIDIALANDSVVKYTTLRTIFPGIFDASLLTSGQR
jgi:cytidine deaminase